MFFLSEALTAVNAFQIEISGHKNCYLLTLYKVT